MSDQKLSLHIGETNEVSLTSGMWDRSIDPQGTQLRLNYQSITTIGTDAGTPVGLTFISAHHLYGCATQTCPRTRPPMVDAQGPV